MKSLLVALIATGPLLAQNVTITPSSLTIAPGAAQQFTAISSGTAFSPKWVIAGVAGGNAVYGTITTDGLYTAPATAPQPGTFLLSAMTNHGGVLATAAITVTNSNAPGWSVTYLANGATSGAVPTDPNLFASGAPVTVSGNSGNLAESGFTFSGWNTASNGSGAPYAPGATLTMGSSNVTLYAQWTARATYSVTYAANGATTGAPPVDGNYYAQGAVVTVPGNPGNLTESGFTFAGWNTAPNGSGAFYAPGATFAMGSGNLTLYAQFAAATTYSLAYAANGATSGAAPVDNGRYASGALVTVLGAGGLAKSGYNFSAWNTALDGSGVTYTAGSTLIMPANSVTLYAQWTSANGGYSITYAGNGATFGFGPLDPTSYAAGQQVLVFGNLGYLFKPDYSFAGWNTAADGSGAAYAQGSMLSMPPGGITLYAQWSTANVPVSIWGGAEAAMALKADGTVWTWGLDNAGQLGDGATGVDSDAPVQVVGPNGIGHLTGITAIMSGEQHKVALRNDGTVWAWGMNSLDQLGNGNTTQSATPVQVSNLTNIVRLGGRAYHSLAVRADGTVWAWGWDRSGALGNGVADTNADFPVPVQVQGVSNPIMVSDGYAYSVALLQDHTLVAWGSNKGGQLGNGTFTDSLTPVHVQGLTNVVWVSAGWGQVIAIKADGTVWTWGANTWNGSYPGSGLLGNGTSANSAVPQQVPGLSGAIKGSGGDSHTAVLLRDGSVWSFGSNSAGQLGIGTFTTQSLVPVQTQVPCAAVDITARDWHSQAICADGSVWSWGSGQAGELGNGTQQNSAVPVLARQF